MTHEYAFDVKLHASIRVNARSEEEARDLLHQRCDTMDCNGGAWPDGSPILFEASCIYETEPEIFEIDGEEYP